MAVPLLVATGLAQFNQHAVAAFRVYENDPGTMGSRRGFLTKELIAFAPQTNHIGIDIIGSETKMMDTPAAFF
jgi:hypothetical protein